MTSSDRPMQKLSRTMMRSWVARQLKVEQNGMCPVCRNPIDLTIKGEGVVDHNHTTGEIRGVLHRSCNAALGKVDNAAGRWGAKSMEYPAILSWLEGMLQYYKSPGCNLIYPMHKTPDEKKDARNALARQRRAEAKAKLALRSRSTT